MKRNVEEYMALPYTIEIIPDEGSCFVKVKELEGCMSVGETRADTFYDQGRHARMVCRCPR